MHGELRFTEDLRQLAVDSFALAHRLCDSCRNYHGYWPYHRLADKAGDAGAELVFSTLRALLSNAVSRVLIAGSADTALLSGVARSAIPGTDITVLDRCRTPLRLCSGFADRWSLPINLIHLDLAKMEMPAHFDVVLAHMLLQFDPRDRHLEILSRLRQALRPDGRLVMVFRTSPRSNADVVSEYRSKYTIHLIEQLEAKGVPLPQPRDIFLDGLETYFGEWRQRVGAHTSRDDVERLVTEAGFAIETIAPIGPSSRFIPFRRLSTELQRFMLVATPAAVS